MNDPNQPEGTIRIQLDQNTIVYVREGADVEAVKEKFLNRNKNRGDYGYLFDYGQQRTFKPKRTSHF